MGAIRVGTASWTDRTLLASGWYPDGVDSAEERLNYYASHFPLVEVHPHAELAAEAAEAAGAQGKFWPMHDLLFENQQHLKANHLRGYAQRLELDLARYDYEMGDHVYLQRVREHIASGVASGVRGTPGFYLNGAYQDVSFGFEHMMEAVRQRMRAPPPRSGRKS